MKSIKQLFFLLFVFIFVLIAATAASMWMVRQTERELTRVNADRYQSYLLADELRQSSDDLTRLARTYVISGDPMWEQQYLEVIEVRNGKRPRPTE